MTVVKMEMHCGRLIVLTASFDITQKSDLRPFMKKNIHFAEFMFLKILNKNIITHMIYSGREKGTSSIWTCTM